MVQVQYDLELNGDFANIGECGLVKSNSPTTQPQQT